MKKNVITNMINKFYLNLSSDYETTIAIKLLKKPGRDRLLTRIMKKQWDSIRNGNLKGDVSDED